MFKIIEIKNILVVYLFSLIAEMGENELNISDFILNSYQVFKLLRKKRIIKQ